MFVQQIILATNKENFKTLHNWHLREFHKGTVFEKCFHVMVLSGNQDS